TSPRRLRTTPTATKRGQHSCAQAGGSRAGSGRAGAAWRSSPVRGDRMPERRRRASEAGTEAFPAPRFTVDASVFVNAFNPHEDGHDASLAFLAAIHTPAHPPTI